MLRPYKLLLARPGALKFSLSGLLARLPLSMIGIGITLMVRGLYGSYSLAGAVMAVYVIVQAVASPQIARMVDRHGQARIMVPLVIINASFLVIMIVLAQIHVADWVLFVIASLAGATFGSIGAMVRSRWSFILRDSPREVHTAFSLEAAFDEIVFIIGPVLATLLATSTIPGLDKAWPPAGVAVAALIAVVGGLIFLNQRETEPPPIKAEVAHQGSVLRSKGLIIISMVFLFVGAVFGATDISTIAMTEELNQKSMAGVVLAVFAAGSCISGFGYGLRNWVWPTWKRFALGVTVLGLGVCTFFFVTTIPALMAAMFVTGLAISPTLVTGNAMITDFVAKGRLTEGLTWAGTAMGFGVSGGSALAGALIDEHASHAGFGVVVACGALTVLVTFAALPLLRKKSNDAQATFPELPDTESAPAQPEATPDDDDPSPGKPATTEE